MIDKVLEARLRANPPKTRGGDPDAIIAEALADRAAVEAHYRFQPDDAVLDVGCGYGRLGLAFAGTGVRYAGVDVNPARLEYATRLLDGFPAAFTLVGGVLNTRYAKGQKPAKPFAVLRGYKDGHFAAAYAISVFTHMADQAWVREYLLEIGRVVRAGGYFLSTWLTAPQPTGDDHRAYHTQLNIADWLASAGFVSWSATGDGTVDSHLRILCKRDV